MCHRSFSNESPQDKKWPPSSFSMMGSPHTRQEQDDGKLWAPLGIFQWGSPLNPVTVEIHLDLIQLKTTRNDSNMEDDGGSVGGGGFDEDKVSNKYFCES